MNVLELLLGSLPLLLQFYVDLYLKIDLEKTMVESEPEYNVPKIKMHDFIIVGGGSAGCILASRLSEYFDVLLLEAGGDPPPASAVPYYIPAVRSIPSIHHLFKTVPQTNASLCCDGILNAATGRMLGGSASHNTMIHSRGSPKDFDNWANILNDDSFNYTNVLKYFKRMETFVGYKLDEESDEYYGNDGPIQVKTNMIPLLDLWFEAGRELEYQNFDPNGFQQEGFATVNVARLSKIVFKDFTGRQAYGVVYTRHDFPQIAHATNEIILSAGIFSSPLLLMKSGIGPETVLNAAEIPVKVALEAVGKNLVEHPCFPILGFQANDSSLFPKMNPSETNKILEEYHMGEGLLTTPTGSISNSEQGVLTIDSVGAQCFITSSKAQAGWPDIWIEMHPFVSIDGKKQGINFYNVIGRPRSRGVLTLDVDKYKAGI